MSTFFAALQYPRVLSIAGSDSGGGAGIQADLKTFAALGCFGMSAITALTAQNTQGVRAIHAVPASMLQEQIDAVVQDMGVHAVKIGMLHCAEVVEAVAQAMDRYQLPHVVLDPVMVATSGAVLIEQPAIQALVAQLFGRVAIVTPNLDEAALLVGRSLETTQDMERAAVELMAMGARAVLIKGGHLAGDTVHDLLSTQDGLRLWMDGPRIATGNTHGTGCTLSSAIAAHLALGKSLTAAVQCGRAFVRGALEHGAAVRTGQGSGPLNHGFAPVSMHLLPPDAAVPK